MASPFERSLLVVSLSININAMRGTLQNRERASPLSLLSLSVCVDAPGPTDSTQQHTLEPQDSRGTYKTPFVSSEKK